MDPAEAELETRVARLFARRPELWRFAGAIAAAVAARPEARRLLCARTFRRPLH